MYKFIYFLIIAIISLNAQSTVVAYITDEHPDSRYTLHNNGTVTDNNTGLMWKVCSQGQTWSASTCSGTASKNNWQAALTQGTDETFASYNDWRLPNIKELRSIAAYNRYNPSINETIFPNTPADLFWSSSPRASNSGKAWLLYFNYGDHGGNYRSHSHRVRLLRSGQ